MRLNGLNIVESFSWWELHNRSCLSTISLIQPFEPLAEKVDEIPGGLNQAVLTSTIRLSPSKLVAKQMLSQQGRYQSTHLERPGDPVAGHEIGVCFLDSLRDQNHQTINNTEMYVETFFKAVANSLHVKHKRYQSEVKSKDHEHPRRTYWCWKVPWAGFQWTSIVEGIGETHGRHQIHSLWVGFQVEGHSAPSSLGHETNTLTMFIMVRELTRLETQ